MGLSLKLRQESLCEETNMAERVYRDPIHGAISFDWEKEKFIIDLIDTKEFQRLRRIRQLGGVSLVFHGAEHTRFTHSLGVAFLAKRIFDKIEKDPFFPPGASSSRNAVLAGALLHDIGHGPFSHLFERVFDIPKHEEWGLRIIQDPETDVSKVLQKYLLADDVRRIFQKKFEPRFARDIISSQLDADRLDYLVRDSYMTGVEYGRYDLDWLLEVMELGTFPNNGKQPTLCINRKNFHAAEDFVIGRHLMYQQIYYHKTVRSAERMIKLIFECLVELVKSGKQPSFYPNPLPQLTTETGTRLSVRGYLQLDDFFMMTCFKEWSADSNVDLTLSDLCKRVVNRQLFKTTLVDPTKIKDMLKYTSAVSALKEAMTKSGFDPRYYLASDTAEDFPYKDIMFYLSQGKSEDIWLAENGVVTQGLSDPTISPMIDSIRNTRIAVQRLCFPKEVQELVETCLKDYLTDYTKTGLYTKVNQPAFDFARSEPGD